MRTKVSFAAETMIPVELKGFTAVLTQREVGPICPPSMANGTVMQPPSTASQMTPNTPMIAFWSAKTARIRRKKRNDVEGTAAAKHQPSAT